MALSSHISNDIEKLAEKLAYSIDKNPVSFKQKEYIIVQTEGMSKWLSVKLAEKNGIFANFEFLSPNQILFELFRIAGIRNSEMYKTDNLKWIIFNILDKKEFKLKFKSTYDYFKNDNIKRLQLATKVADLFDQYSIYRPDYILQWNQNKEANVKPAYRPHERWQRYVWTEVKNIIQKQDNVENREYLLDNLKNNKELTRRIKSVFKRISIFGFSVFTPFHLEVFLEYLPGLIDVNFYLFNPAPEDYWLQDIPEKTKVLIERRYGEMSKELLLTSGNKLLMNLAKTAKEMYLILLNNESFVNNLDNETLLNKPGNRTLLNIIQRDIYSNVKPKTGKLINASLINDGSLSVVSNYTPMREVEVLYNYLLRQIEINGYKPNDFIVMTSNIDTYTPYIKAVFDNSPVKLPYTIADRSYVGTDNLVGILKQILLLQKDEFTSENVMQILEFDEVKNKFDIKNLLFVREIIKNANIRHGIEGNINDETVFVSWRYGLNRIVMGYAIKTDELYYPKDSEIPVLPLKSIEGDYATEGLKLINFVNTLIEFIQKRNTERTLDQWRIFVLEYIDKLMEISEEKSDQLNYIVNKISFPDQLYENISKKISYEVFSKSLIDSLYSNTRSSKFISGQITFCSMIPMRSIPYKVIAILGLNHHDFPRKTSEIGFDLMLSEHRYADRNVKDTDKYLFLETLMSTKEKLYLSYIGKNIKDNSDIPPSMVISELLDYIDENIEGEDAAKNIVKQHPLHNFDDKYFSREEDYYTYLNYNNEGYQIEQSTKPVKEDEEINEVSLKNLVALFKNPFKWFFNNTLNIYYKNEEILLPDTELFELNNLIKSEFNNRIIKEENNIINQEFLTKEKIKGKLPLKNISNYEIEKLVEEFEPVIEKFKNIRGKNEEKKIKIDFKTNSDIRITGEITNIWGDKLILFNTSKSAGPKNIVAIQLYRWVCSILDVPVNKFIILDKDSKNDLELLPEDKEKSIAKFEKSIKLFFRGRKEILPFFPKASKGYMKSKKIESFIKELDTTKKGNYNSSQNNGGSYIDPYLKKLSSEKYFNKYRNENKQEEIMEIAHLFFEDI